MNRTIRILRLIFWRLIWEARTLAHSKPKVSHPEAIELGSPHSKRCVIPLPELKGSLAICGGAGEDISFELELVRHFGAVAVLVDPVPRAESHFTTVLDRLGMEAKLPYTRDGQQPCESYNLVGVSRDSLEFQAKALWNKTGDTIELFPPLDSNHVSYSAIDLQRTGNSPINVPTITVKEIVESNPDREFQILKLDIEGAALEVLEGMFDAEIFPTQITLEIDEIGYLNIANFRRAKRTIRLLESYRYYCFWRRSADYSFWRQPLVAS